MAALIEYANVHPSSVGPLFVFQDGRYLTRRNFVNALNKFKPDHVADVSSHSFRIGGATAAAAAGYPQWLIQALGRWASDCYKEYIRVSDSMKQRVSRSMAAVIEVDAGNAFDPDLVTSV